MKKYHVVQFVSNFMILCIGALLLIYPALGIEDVNYLFFIIMLCYGLISYGNYMVIRRKGDYEYLFTSLASIIAGCGGIVLHSQKPTLVLSISLMAWITMIAVIKLIKIDYYNDRNNPLWVVRTFAFIIFIIVGTLTCINLYYNIEIQSLMLGFFFVAVSVLEIFDPLADYIMGKNIKKLRKQFHPEVIKENAITQLEEELKKEQEIKAQKEAEKKTAVPVKKTATKKTTAAKSTAKKTTAKKTTTTKKTPAKSATAKNKTTKKSAPTKTSKGSAPAKKTTPKKTNSK